MLRKTLKINRFQLFRKLEKFCGEVEVVKAEREFQTELTIYLKVYYQRYVFWQLSAIPDIPNLGNFHYVHKWLYLFKILM